MDPSTINTSTQWIIAHGYLLMFLAMCLEGPMVTVAAAFAAALGYFNPFVVLALSISGDILPDIVAYAAGYWLRKPVVERFGKRVGLSPQRMDRMEGMLRKHQFKFVAAAKFTPVIPTVSLMLIGAVRLPFPRFLWLCFLITGPRSVLMTIVGFYFGWAYDAISQYLETGTLIVVLIALIVFFAFAYRAIFERISRLLAEE